MNGVIARLVLRALPMPSGVRPRVASRFDPGASAPVRPSGVAVLEAGPEQIVDSKEHTRADAGPSNAVGTAGSPASASYSPFHRSADMPAVQSGVPTASCHVEASSATRSRVRAPGERAFGDNHALPSSDIGEEPARNAPILPDQPINNLARPREGRVVTEISHVPLLPQRAQAFKQAAVPAEPLNLGTHGDVASKLPDINISIGRIEVRATPQERPAQPTRAPRPQLMSLEDYLDKGRTRQ